MTKLPPEWFLSVISNFCFISYIRTLPNKHMENIVETLAKFRISALLVIGGFEVKNKTPPFKEPELNYLYINLKGQCYIKEVFNLDVTFKGVRRCAAAVWSPESLWWALHPHVCNPCYHQQQCPWNWLQPGSRHGCQCCHGGNAEQVANLQCGFYASGLTWKETEPSQKTSHLMFWNSLYVVKTEVTVNI